MTGIRPYGPHSLWGELFGHVSPVGKPPDEWSKPPYYESKPIEITGLEKKDMKTPHNCGSCRYFHNAQRTLCKRYPPVAHGKREALWPAVYWGDTCGEWAPRIGEEGTS